eukprot:4866542-Pyramimonas_sp.AAC.1
MRREHPDLHARIALSWGKILSRLRLAGTRRWRIVKGPIGATVATLMDIGWIPHSPMIWESESHVWAIPPCADVAFSDFSPGFTDLLDEVEAT